MTRKDYIKISEVLREAKPKAKRATLGEKKVWQAIVTGLIGVLRENPHFDPARFQAECEGRDDARPATR